MREPVARVAREGSIQSMTETPEPSTKPTSAAAAPPSPAQEALRLPRLYTAAAWVVIVAGIVFILSTIFFAGAMVFGISHHCSHRHHHDMMYKPGGPWGPGGGPWQYGGPGMGPYGPPPPGYLPGAPGGAGQMPTTSAPTPAPNTPATPRP
jgi:hypothetical protein